MSDPLDSGSACFLNIAFEDENGDPPNPPPTAVLISIRAVSPPRLLRDAVPLDTPAASVRFMVTKDENTMVGRAPAETRRATAVALTADPNFQFVTHFDYQLRRAT